jgi:hypothetical protein
MPQIVMFINNMLETKLLPRILPHSKQAEITILHVRYAWFPCQYHNIYIVAETLTKE